MSKEQEVALNLARTSAVWLINGYEIGWWYYAYTIERRRGTHWVRHLGVAVRSHATGCTTGSQSIKLQFVKIGPYRQPGLEKDIQTEVSTSRLIESWDQWLSGRCGQHRWEHP